VFHWWRCLVRGQQLLGVDIPGWVPTRGKIVVCDRNVSSRAAKGDVVCHAGAAWMVLANM
jgi:hypothetical protein